MLWINVIFCILKQTFIAMDPEMTEMTIPTHMLILS